MTRPLRIGLIVGTTREGRFADKPANWLFELASKRGDAEYELVDLRDYPLPFFDEPRSPMFLPPKSEVAKRWATKLGELDGFVFVTAEYNHSVSGALKNALDYAYAEFVRKPASFLAYGAAGGARAVEHLRGILVELQVAPLRHAVHINMHEFVGMMREGKTFADYPYLADAASKMLDDLLWWTKTLRAGREGSAT